MSSSEPEIQYNFIGNVGSGDDVDVLGSLTWEAGTVACMMHAWVWPLYCQLRDRGMPVSFGYALRPDAVNFIHGEVARYQLSGTDLNSHYIVAIRADFRAFPFANIEVVQNRSGEAGRTVFMPHFPQPGLRSRSPDRTVVENICFSGQLENFGVDVARFERDLAKLGCRFVYKKVGEWQHMEDVDVLLGFRALSKERFNSKPPTKLFNAWLAGIPFIGGYDSACEQVGVPGRDYIQVCSYGGLLEEIAKLKEDADYYGKFVEAGWEAGRGYTAEQIANRWVAFLGQRVVPDFQKWRSGFFPDRIRGVVRGIAFSVWEKRLRGYRRANEWK